MINLGWQELLIILAIVLIIFGPGRLPEIGRWLGKEAKSFRKQQDEDDDSDT